MGADTLEECLSLHFDSKGRIDGFAFPEHDRLYPSASKLKDVDELAKAYLGFKFHKETALAIGYWKGQQSKIYTYGKKCKACTEEANSLLLFQIGSVSKVFTALLLAQDSIKNKLPLQ
jgi:CubicO group peptidase (beta-lactamase class C family)